MNRCNELKEWLLEAGPEDLARVPPEQRKHLDACTDCSARFAAIVDVTAALADGLAAHVSNLRAEDAVRLATRHSTGSAEERRTGRRLARGLRWAPLAAAAAVVLFLRGPGDSGAPPDLTWLEPETFETFAFSVEAAESGSVAVFPTPNPKIHVVWLYETTRTN